MNAKYIFKANGADEAALRQTYAYIFSNFQKGARSLLTKNMELSGDPAAGSVIARRLQLAESAAYGTARTAGKGSYLNTNSITISLDTPKEIVEELNWHDTRAFGVDALVAKAGERFPRKLIRELDTAYFTEAVAEGTLTTVSGSTVAEKVLSLGRSLEAVSNDYVDGIEREMIVINVLPDVYDALFVQVSGMPNPANGGVRVGNLAGFTVVDNFRQSVDAIAMVKGAIAQPVSVKQFGTDEHPLSAEIILKMFYDYGTQAVQPELIKYAGLDTIVS